MRALLVAFLLAATAAAADAVPPYTDIAAWNDDATTLGFQIEAFGKCRGRLAEKPRFSGCVRMWEDAYRRWNRLSAQAADRASQDAAGAEATALAERAKALGERLDEAAAFFQPEVRALGRTKVTRLLAYEKTLAKYREAMEKVLRARAGAPVDARALWKAG